MTSNSFDALVREKFDELRSHLPAPVNWMLLHIGDEQSALVTAVDDATLAAAVVYNLGSHRTARELFNRAMPDALALENAIAMVEDEIARLPDIRTASSVLVTQDALIRDIALRSGVSHAIRMEVPLETIERCFDRLAKVAQGSPAAYEGLPQDPAFAATLLILRELMHHRRFASILILAPE